MVWYEITYLFPHVSGCMVAEALWIASHTNNHVQKCKLTGNNVYKHMYINALYNHISFHVNNGAYVYMCNGYFFYLCFMHKKRRDYHASLYPYPFSIISGCICDALKLDYTIRYIKACKPLILDMSFDRGPSSWFPLVKLSPSSWKIIKGQSVDRAVRLHLPPLHTQEIWNSMIKTLISYYQYSYVSIIITWPSAKLCLCSFFADICCKQACGFIKIQQFKKNNLPKTF